MNGHHVVKSVLHKAKFLRQATKRYCDWLITETYSAFSLPITFSHEGQCPRAIFGSTVSLVKKTRRSISNVEKRLFKIVTVNLTVSAKIHGLTVRTPHSEGGSLYPPKWRTKQAYIIKDNYFASQSWCRTQNIHLLFIK